MSGLSISGLLGGCSDADPAPYKAPLKLFLSERLRAQDFFVDLTDEDPRARPPTKYDDATKGIAFALRHNVHYRKETPVVVATWIFESEKAARLAKEPMQGIIADLKKQAMLYKMVPLETKELHGYLLMESSSPALSNVFELVARDVQGGIAGVKPEEKK